MEQSAPDAATGKLIRNALGLGGITGSVGYGYGGATTGAELLPTVGEIGAFTTVLPIGAAVVGLASLGEIPGVRNDPWLGRAISKQFGIEGKPTWQFGHSAESDVAFGKFIGQDPAQVQRNTREQNRFKMNVWNAIAGASMGAVRRTESPFPDFPNIGPTAPEFNPDEIIINKDQWQGELSRDRFQDYTEFYKYEPGRGKSNGIGYQGPETFPAPKLPEVSLPKGGFTLPADIGTTWGFPADVAIPRAQFPGDVNVPTGGAVIPPMTIFPQGARQPTSSLPRFGMETVAMGGAITVPRFIGMPKPRTIVDEMDMSGGIYDLSVPQTFSPVQSVSDIDYTPDFSYITGSGSMSQNRDLVGWGTKMRSMDMTISNPFDMSIPRTNAFAREFDISVPTDTTTDLVRDMALPSDFAVPYNPVTITTPDIGFPKVPAWPVTTVRPPKEPKIDTPRIPNILLPRFGGGDNPWSPESLWGGYKYRETVPAWMREFRGMFGGKPKQRRKTKRRRKR